MQHIDFRYSLYGTCVCRTGLGSCWLLRREGGSCWEGVNFPIFYEGREGEGASHLEINKFLVTHLQQKGDQTV